MMSELTGPSRSRTVLEIAGLSKSFGSVCAADDVALAVRDGEALGGGFGARGHGGLLWG